MVIGKLVNFFLRMINRYHGREEERQVEPIITNDQICNEITGGHVQHWSESGNLYLGGLIMKYAIIHRISTVNWVPTQHTSTISSGLGKKLLVLKGCLIMEDIFLIKS